LLEAAVTAASGRSRQCEPLRAAPPPLDVLCQQLLGMAAAGPCDADAAFALVRRASPYRDLNRRDFEDCLRYLLGRDRCGEPWLPARLVGTGGEFTICDERTARLLRRNLGSILDDERATVLLENAAGADEAPRAIGEVDHAFADRLTPGDRFLLDGRCLEFRRRRGLGVLVREVPGRPRSPRWSSDGWPLSPELARRLCMLRTRAAEALREAPAALTNLLRRDYHLDGDPAALLSAYFHAQESVSEIPDPETLLIEVVGVESGGDYYVHTPLNRLANDALARVAVRRLARDQGRSASSLAADLGFSVQVRGSLAAPDALPELWRSLLAAEGFDADLAAALADGPALRERFQRVAHVGLMLLRNPIGRRRRVGGREWGSRQLYDRVKAHDPDFVLLRQSLREVQTDLCDAASARPYLVSLPERTVRCRWLRTPSPFARGWTQAEMMTEEAAETSAEALQRFHAALMGAPARR
jgi:ATP-dependent Lhr-like helicase